ncbi:hypothetical protein DEFDS_2082 [Deferribacter desulfuricans SSM1]|uniref:Uncharacterized protein n=1 Tax=Deferribacter desulfuricans (strain DSM 14783 / JCM 11476 / NBRC 101012 / SSM1) TaxID=639282 RepID=D3P9Z1_DEFDS|nr:hypothetical protein [Deferribacter desulfuricans]BAI81531.1 hypothetical protein DEFDS_2082 [Deferribacter desulfuricans SSM1]
MFSFKKLSLFIIMFLSIIFLYGCFDDNGDNNAVTTSGSFLPYEGSINLVDAEDPTLRKTVVDGQIDDYLPVFKIKNYNTDTGIYTGLHYDSIFYIYNGIVYKLNLHNNGESFPSPVAVGDITNANGIAYLPDFKNDITYLLVYTDNDKSYLLKYNNGQVINKIEFNYNIFNSDVLYSSDGTLTKFLIGDNNTIKICDTDLQNCTIAFTGSDEFDLLGYKTIETKYYSINNYIFKYNKDNNSLDNTSIAVPAGFVDSYTDNNSLYFLNIQDNNYNLPAHFIISKYYFDNNSMSNIFNDNFTDNCSLVDADLIGGTDNYIILTVEYANPSCTNHFYSEIWAMKKDGSSHLVIYQPPEGYKLESFGSDTFILDKNKLYFNKVSDNGTKVEACYWEDNDNNTHCYDSQNNSYWMLATLSSTNTVDIYNFQLPVDKLLLVENPTIVKNNDINKELYLYGGDLRVITKESIVNNFSKDDTIYLGTLPDDGYRYLYIDQNFNFSDSILFDMEFDDDNSDVFYVNLNNSNSLYRVTETPDKDEVVIDSLF